MVRTQMAGSVGIHIILSIVFPETHLTNLVIPALVQRFMFTTRTAVLHPSPGFGNDRPSVHPLPLRMIKLLFPFRDQCNQLVEILVVAGEVELVECPAPSIGDGISKRFTDKRPPDFHDLLPAHGFDTVTPDLSTDLEQAMFADDDTRDLGSPYLDAGKHSSPEKAKHIQKQRKKNEIIAGLKLMPILKTETDHQGKANDA